MPPVPELKTHRYVFPYKDDMNVTDVGNISRETENKQHHEWNWYCQNSNLRGQINERHGVNAFCTRPYAKIGGKSK
eukprot:9221785-Ditylum_brightwellii.AAC.1